MEKQFLTFVVAKENYGLEISHVREIIEYGEITHLPLLPPYIRGVISLRGTPVPVVELGVLFGEEAAAITRYSCIIITEVFYNNKPIILGILVDAVNEVITLAEKDMEPRPEIDIRTKTDYILGMTRLDKKFIVMLDMEKVLQAEQLDAIFALHRQVQGEETATKVN